MNKLTCISMFLALSALGGSASADNLQPLPNAPLQPRNSFPASGPGSEPQPVLTKNYEITLTVTAHEKAVGEMSLLTCSPSVQVQANIDLTESPTMMRLTGTLAERENGALSLNFSLGFDVPLVTSSPGQPINGPQPGMIRNVQYQNHSATCSLLMKPGDSYDFFKAAGRTYTLKITPMPDK